LSDLIKGETLFPPQISFLLPDLAFRTPTIIMVISYYYGLDFVVLLLFNQFHPKKHAMAYMYGMSFYFLH
jgi:hypothetical protein